MRKMGIKPSQMKIEGKAQDSLENLLFSLKKIKGTEIGVASYPGHLDRFEYIVEKAKKDGAIDNEIKIHRIETKEAPGEYLKHIIYETFAKALTKYKLRKGIGEGKLHKDDSAIKKITNYIFR